MVTRWPYAKDSGSDCGWVDLVQWTQTGTEVAALATALDAAQTFTTGGGANWSSQTTTYYHDGDAAKTGSIANYGQSWMQTTIQGAGIVRFYWKVSSQYNNDFLEFFIDGVLKDHISGEVDWQAKSYTVTGSGTHTLRWRYIKNSSSTSGSDCGWVDYVQTPVPADWQTITYTYDPSGRRIAKSYDGQIVAKYLYDGPSLIAEYDGFNNLLRKYIYGPGIDQPICMIDVQHDSEVYYYHFDGLGSVIALTDDSGDTAELYEYSIFGEVSASDPTNPNPFLFTGREFDKETGLYYYRARYYNPYIGRFLQTDPAGDGMNHYAYCGNDPIGAVDPSGMWPIDCHFSKDMVTGADGSVVQRGIKFSCKVFNYSKPVEFFFGVGDWVAWFEWVRGGGEHYRNDENGQPILEDGTPKKFYAFGGPLPADVERWMEGEKGWICARGNRKKEDCRWIPFWEIKTVMWLSKRIARDVSEIENTITTPPTSGFAWAKGPYGWVSASGWAQWSETQDWIESDPAANWNDVEPLALLGNVLEQVYWLKCRGSRTDDYIRIQSIAAENDVRLALYNLGFPMWPRNLDPTGGDYGGGVTIAGAWIAWAQDPKRPR